VYSSADLAGEMIRVTPLSAEAGKPAQLCPWALGLKQLFHRNSSPIHPGFALKISRLSRSSRIGTGWVIHLVSFLAFIFPFLIVPTNIASCVAGAFFELRQVKTPAACAQH
jgi:hypothetical protein